MEEQQNTFSLQMHHVGCAVDSIAESLETYQTLGFQNISQIYHIESQKVNACFVETAPSVYLELLEPSGEGSAIATYLKRRQNYYHVCYATPKVEEKIADLEQEDFELITLFNSQAFSNSKCAFLWTPDKILLELCEAGSFKI